MNLIRKMKKNNLTIYIYMSSLNNQITLSGQDGIEVDEIDFAEGGKFFIGGKNPINKAFNIYN